MKLQWLSMSQVQYEMVKRPNKYDLQGTFILTFILTKIFICLILQ